MNIWIKKSIELASQPGYLDKLHAVYPMEQGGLREVPLDTQEKIKQYLVNNNQKELIGALLGLELFPIKDSYVAYFRRNPDAIDSNPETVERIFLRLKNLGFQEIIKSSSQPKELNRQIGPMFRRWLPTLGYPMLTENEFLNSEETAFLAGSDTALKNFANKYLGTNLKKGLDLVLKKDKKFVIGESKFLTDFGGHQNAQFNDPLGLLTKRGDKEIMRIAVLDGVIWVPSNNQMHKRVKQGNKTALSALLLDDFIKSL